MWYLWGTCFISNALPQLGRACTPQAEVECGEGTPNLWSALTWTLASVTQTGRLKIVPLPSYGDIVCPLLGAGERDYSLVGHTYQEWSFCYAQLGMRGRVGAGYDSSFTDSQVFLRFSRFY